MTKKNSDCILTDYRRDNCANCDGVCSYRIAIQGINGDGGRLASAGIPAGLRKITLANSPAREDQRAIYESLEKYVATFTREPSEIKSLYLWSEATGTGKTTTASALLTEFIVRQYLTNLRDGSTKTSAYFLDVNEAQTEYNTFNRPRVPDRVAEPASERYYGAMERAQYADYAVLDDIGVRGIATDGFRGDLHTVINHRVANLLPTIYTSNLRLADMQNVFDMRLYDRMRDRTGEIMFAGDSKRGRR